MWEIAVAGLLGLFGLLALHGRERSVVSRSEAVRRVVRHLVRRPIDELHDGDAAVVRGTASAIVPPLLAPISGRPCIGYHVRIYLQAGYALIVDHARCNSFEITDATGRVCVRAEGLELAVTTEPLSPAWPPLPPPLLLLLPAHCHGQPVRWTEGLLLEGAQVAACGVMRTTVIGGEMYRDLHTRGELIASPTFPLVASPDPDLAWPSPRPYQPEELRG